MQHKKYLLNLFEAIPKEQKNFLDAIRTRYELEANRNRMELSPAVLEKVLTKDELTIFEQLYQEAHKAVLGPNEFKNASAYLDGHITAKDLLKIMDQKPSKSDSKNADMADLLAGRILRTMKPKV